MSAARAVHVVIVNYKSAHHVANCVESLRPHNVKSICVVDNKSGGREIELLHELLGPEQNVRIAENSENLGFGHGVNFGVSTLDCDDEDYLWVLNPDTLVRNRCVDELIRVSELGYDMVSPLIVSGVSNDERIWFAGGEVDLVAIKTPHRRFGDPASSAKELAPIINTDFITGTAPFLTIRLWHLLGGFREDLFMYWEDADLSVRAKDKGLTMVVATQAHVWHAVGGTSGGDGLSPLYYRFMQRNRARLAREWGVAGNIGRGRGFIETVRLLVKPLFEPSCRSESARASISGLREGLRHR